MRNKNSKKRPLPKISVYDGKDTLNEHLIQLNEDYEEERGRNAFTPYVNYIIIFGALSFGIAFGAAYFAATSIPSFSMPFPGGLGLNAPETHFTNAFEFAFILGASAAGAAGIAFAARGANAVQEQSDHLTALSSTMDRVTDMIGSIELEEAVAKKEKREALQLLAKAGHAPLLQADLDLETYSTILEEQLKDFNKSANEVFETKKVEPKTNEAAETKKVEPKKLLEFRNHRRQINQLVEKNRRLLKKLVPRSMANVAILPTDPRVEELKAKIEGTIAPIRSVYSALLNATSEIQKSEPRDLDGILSKTNGVINALKDFEDYVIDKEQESSHS